MLRKEPPKDRYTIYLLGYGDKFGEYPPSNLSCKNYDKFAHGRIGCFYFPTCLQFRAPPELRSRLVFQNWQTLHPYSYCPK